MKRLTLVSITILYSMLSHSQSLTKEKCYDIIYNSIKNRKIQIEDVNITTNDSKEFLYTYGDNKLVYKNGVAYQYYESTETFVKAKVDFFLVHPIFEILQIEYFTKGTLGDGYIQFYTEYLNDEFNEMKWTLHFNESNDLVSIESYQVQYETNNKIDLSIVDRKVFQIAEYQPESLPNYNNIRVVSTTSSNLKEASLPSDITEVDQLVQKKSQINY
ncbi:hypothetical protein SAMN05421640_1406 [Ekhidna lutea]|uniref:Uncharacterized protein n=1 Tax=Ekhidna lutea TaxID=447679 RepID=A0A239HP82_EKHLU|nr:hypothetical protein [Ekhidna lutea]SNS82723.1 hypothetical protein SAMN05421640_1406 [Ekhidna lutea]